MVLKIVRCGNDNCQPAKISNLNGFMITNFNPLSFKMLTINQKIFHQEMIKIVQTRAGPILTLTFYSILLSHSQKRLLS